MSFTNLHSLKGLEALQRSLETPSVARVARGTLKVDDALGMAEKEAIAAFQLIRWGDTKGSPQCPRCRSTETYTITTKKHTWTCAQCAHRFTLTSSTMLHSNKMGLQKHLAILSLVLDKSQFRSLVEFSNGTGIGYKSVSQQINRYRACTTDTNGCTVPFSLLSRAAWIVRARAMRGNRSPMFLPRTADQNYPYLSDSSKHIDGAELLLFVNKLVCRWVPHYMRADICQDMIVAMLAGEVTREQLPSRAKEFLTKTFQEFPWKYKWMSFDAKIGEDGKRTLHDVMDADSVSDRFQRVY